MTAARLQSMRPPGFVFRVRERLFFGFLPWHRCVPCIFELLLPVQADTWQDTGAANSPAARLGHTAVARPWLWMPEDAQRFPSFGAQALSFRKGGAPAPPGSELASGRVANPNLQAPFSCFRKPVESQSLPKRGHGQRQLHVRLRWLSEPWKLHRPRPGPEFRCPLRKCRSSPQSCPRYGGGLGQRLAMLQCPGKGRGQVGRERLFFFWERSSNLSLFDSGFLRTLSQKGPCHPMSSLVFKL